MMNLIHVKLESLRETVDDYMIGYTYVPAHVTPDELVFNTADISLRNSGLAWENVDLANWVESKFFHMVPCNYPGNYEDDLTLTIDICILISELVRDEVFRLGLPATAIVSVVDLVDDFLILQLSPHGYAMVRNTFGKR